MFSVGALFFVFTCNSCNIKPKEANKCAICADMVTGIALVVIGSLILSGIIPCYSIVGGLLIGIGCLELAMSPLIAIFNHFILARD